MHARPLMSGLVLACGLIAFASTAFADEGQEDLDKATRLKINATSLEQLSEVAKLCESAIEKGLSADNEKYARRLLTSSLYQRAAQLCQPIIAGGRPDPRWRLLRQVALPDLEKIVKYDDQFGEAYLLIARLEALQGGDRENAQKAAARAVELFQNDKSKLSRAILMRAQLNPEPEERLADLSKAIELDPANVDAWQARALYYLTRKDLKKAIEDFNQLLEQDEENVTIRLTVAEALINLEQYEEALSQIDRTLQQQPSSTAYTLRAQANALQDKVDEALKDLDEAIKLEARDFNALMLRARLYYSQERYALAAEDVRRTLQVVPDLPDAILLRSLISTAQDDLASAIKDMEILLKQDPENLEWQLQLALFFNADERPRKAIELYSKLLEKQPDSWMSLRGRGDAYLAIGEHAKAIADYELALKAQPEHSGLLNNFAWVLATSPDDDVRDGKRSLELGTKACELTEFKESHILSTLAAGYAETGDFENAIKWSEKAVELSDESVKEQLQKELESYRQKKPWRERQQVQEKQPADDHSAARAVRPATVRVAA